MSETPIKPMRSDPGGAVQWPVSSPRKAGIQIGRREWAGREVVELNNTRDGMGVTVCPAEGGEICGLNVRNGGEWRELLYRANDWRPIEGWPGRAPWLWPVAGRSYADADATECGYRWNGQVYAIEPHGFIRHRPWRVMQTAAVGATAEVLLAYSTRDSGYDDRARYPFDYTLTLRVQQNDRRVMAHFTCEADAANPGPMPFTWGNHLTLDLRPWWGDNWLSGIIRPRQDTCYQTNERRIAAQAIPIPQALTLNDARLASAVIPAHPSRGVRLESPDGSRAINLGFTADPPIKPGDGVWVTYCDPQGRFFCCEPWLGWPNAMNTGRGRVDLQPGDRMTLTFQIAVESA